MRAWQRPEVRIAAYLIVMVIAGVVAFVAGLAASPPCSAYTADCDTAGLGAVVAVVVVEAAALALVVAAELLLATLVLAGHRRRRRTQPSVVR